jgi:transcriptional regulator with XRE-family HTH domain
VWEEAEMRRYMEPSRDLGNAVWVRRYRELGVGREEFARRTGWTEDGNRTVTKKGLSPASIARIERAQRGVASAAEFNLLAQALDLTPDAFTMRILQASTDHRTGDAHDLPSAIDAVPDADQRALLQRIADDLAGLARSLTGRP